MRYHIEYQLTPASDWLEYSTFETVEEALEKIKMAHDLYSSSFARLRILDTDNGTEFPAELLGLDPQVSDSELQYFSAPSYGQLTSTFGQALVEVSTGSYQGDTWLVIENNGKIGYLSFGWGSCSGCDSLQAANSIKEVEELRLSMLNSIKWFNSPQQALEFFNSHDWEGDYSYHEEEFHDFLAQAKKKLQGMSIEFE